ncbi:hypothetical protein [Actinomadura sp. 6K520]|uniref:hypothetical protein n=1 Tax=Actinomadura sp. 6K520 TaxID=2530364 RepID=UPI0010495B7D|nr:hypothetical protein [Actinomadura sp. 6K520]TDE26478.1 hypothetical protein E1289_25425 [Actinomadura sp. 6K520]
MESYPIKEARKRLGDVYAAVVHGGAHCRVIEKGRDPVMMSTAQERQGLQQMRRERSARLADQEADRIKPYLDVGRTPPGYELYTRERVASGDWLA